MHMSTSAKSLVMIRTVYWAQASPVAFIQSAGMPAQCCTRATGCTTGAHLVHDWMVCTALLVRANSYEQAAAPGESLCWQSARASSIRLPAPYLGDAAGRPDVALPDLREGAAPGNARQRRRHHACSTPRCTRIEGNKPMSLRVLHSGKALARCILSYFMEMYRCPYCRAC